jgi:putative transposase
MPPLDLSDLEFHQLQSIAISRSIPHSIFQRAQIVLACGAAETNTSIARGMGMTVGKWRKRFRVLGLDCLHEELLSIRPRSYEDDTVTEVNNARLSGCPTDSPYAVITFLPNGARFDSDFYVVFF